MTGWARRPVVLIGFAQRALVRLADAGLDERFDEDHVPGERRNFELMQRSAEVFFNRSLNYLDALEHEGEMERQIMSKTGFVSIRTRRSWKSRT
jgi:hypothetical protein